MAVALFREHHWEQLYSRAFSASDALGLDAWLDAELLGYIARHAQGAAARAALRVLRLREAPAQPINTDDPGDDAYEIYWVLREQVEREGDAEALQAAALQGPHAVRRFAFCRLTGYQYDAPANDAYSYATYACKQLPGIAPSRLRGFCEALISGASSLREEAAACLSRLPQPAPRTVFSVRQATEADLPRLLAIYNREVQGGTATMDLQPLSLEARRQWLQAHNTGSHLLLAAVTPSDEAVGYASLSAFNAKAGYDGTVELSIYVDDAYRRQGAARQLMSAILRFARSAPAVHTVISIITAGNAASIALHEEFGFALAGTLREAVRKFGGYLDMLYYQLMV